MSHLRPLTGPEAIRLCMLGCAIAGFDEPLGEIVCLIARGRDDLLPALHDRLNVVGRFEIADSIRAMVAH